MKSVLNFKLGKTAYTLKYEKETDQFSLYAKKAFVCFVEIDHVQNKTYCLALDWNDEQSDRIASFFMSVITPKLLYALTN